MKKLLSVFLVLVLVVSCNSVVFADEISEADIWGALENISGTKTPSKQSGKKSSGKKSRGKKSSGKKKSSKKASEQRSNQDGGAAAQPAAQTQQNNAVINEITSSFGNYAQVQRINSCWCWVTPNIQLAVDPEYFYVYAPGEQFRSVDGVLQPGVRYSVTTQAIKNLRSSDVRGLIQLLSVPGTNIRWLSGTAAQFTSAPWIVQGKQGNTVVDVKFNSEQNQPVGAFIEGLVSIVRR